MAKSEVKVGVIGMGIGRSNARAIAADPRGRVVALCDLDESRMASFAEELPEQPRFYSDYAEMCRDDEIDAVFVGTPNQLHVPVAMEAVRHGRHVLVTKPLAESVESGRRLVEAAEEAGVVNMMSLSTRFGPECRFLADKSAAGYFGEIYYARARSVRRNGIPAWNLGFVQEGGGAFRDMGVHFLDAAWAIMGHPRPVTVTGVAGAPFGPRGQGYWRPTPEEVWRQFAADDYAGGLVRFDNGAGLQVESFWACHQPSERQIELFGTEAGATLEPLKLYRTEDRVEHDEAVALPRYGTVGSYESIAGHFIECILDGKKCVAPLRQGLQVQQMLEALLASADADRELEIQNYAD